MAAGEISTPQEYIGHHLNNLQLDLRTFELHALPEPQLEGLRPGMSVLVNMDEQ